MKIRLLLVLMFALPVAFLFQSCEDDLLNVDEEFYYESEIEVYTTDSVMTVVEVVDMTDQSDIISQYSEKIVGIEILEASYWLTSFEGEDDQEIIASSLKVADADGSGEVLIADIANQNLKALLDTTQSLEVSQAGLDKMAQLIMDDPHKFQLMYYSACNLAPLNFKVKFQFKIKMTANPLN